MVKSGMFDLSALLELKKESESQAATEASEPQKVSQDAAAEAQTNDEKPEEPDNATIMADGCEGDHADAPKQVPRAAAPGPSLLFLQDEHPSGDCLSLGEALRPLFRAGP